MSGTSDDRAPYSRLRVKYVQLDPDEPMVGTCTACKTELHTLRRKTLKDKRSPANAHLGAWVDLPYVECPKCKEASAALIKRAGTKREPVGTRVYVCPVKRDTHDQSKPAGSA